MTFFSRFVILSKAKNLKASFRDSSSGNSGFRMTVYYSNFFFAKTSAPIVAASSKKEI
jgi:hypothetical protein